MKNFKQLNIIVGWLTFLVAAITYLLTIEPTASFWDCGEFITTSFKLEVGHPPGAPFFMIMGRLFNLFAIDNAHIAIMVNSMSALASDAALIDPGCNAGIVRYTAGGRDVLAFTNAASAKRENLSVKLSYDGGLTWPAVRVIHAGPAAYSTVIVLRDGSLGVLYERGEKQPAERITFARFGLDWVEGKK